MVNLVAAAAAARVPRLLFLSSTAVYGDASAASTETSAAQPVDAYGAEIAHDSDYDFGLRTVSN